MTHSTLHYFKNKVITRQTFLAPQFEPIPVTLGFAIIRHYAFKRQQRNVAIKASFNYFLGRQVLLCLRKGEN